MKVIGYLRVSTADQDTEKNKADVLAFANGKGLLKVQFVEEKVSGLKSWRKRKLNDVVVSMDPGDVLIVPELSRLGRSLVEVLEVLNILSTKDVAVYSVKENFQLNGKDLQSKVMRTLFGLMAEIERDLIVSRTLEGLKAARAQGRVGGRKKGVLQKSRLDPHKAEIAHLLAHGSTQTWIARHYGVKPLTLAKWMASRGLQANAGILLTKEQ